MFLFQGPQQNMPLQDGGYSISQRPATRIRFVDKNQGRKNAYFLVQFTKINSSCDSSGRTAATNSYQFGLDTAPRIFYETHQACHGIPAQQRGPQHHLNRRNPSHGTIRGAVTLPHSHDSPTRVTGLLSQLPEVTAGASWKHRLFGLQGGLKHTLPQPARAKGCSRRVQGNMCQ